MMKASRDLKDLTKEFYWQAVTFVEQAEARGLEVLIYCTYRPPSVQARRFRQGRSLAEIERKADELRIDWGRQDLADLLMAVGPQHGPLVTNAGPGQSNHQYARAFDGAPMRQGEIVWGTERKEDMELWERYGSLARAMDLEWAGDWSMFPEFPHVQQPTADWRSLIADADLDLRL